MIAMLMVIKAVRYVCYIWAYSGAHVLAHRYLSTQSDQSTDWSTVAVAVVAAAALIQAAKTRARAYTTEFTWVYEDFVNGYDSVSPWSIIMPQHMPSINLLTCTTFRWNEMKNIV